MEISLFIAELLRQNDEVSFPGLGTFFKERVEGYYNPHNNTFIPPKERLSFSTSYTENTLLRDYISTQERISASSASDFLQENLTDLQNQLEKSSYSEFKPLGIIRKVKNDYLFDTNEMDFLDSFYGLKPISEQKANPAVAESEDENDAAGSAQVSTESDLKEDATSSMTSNSEIETSENQESTLSLHKLILRENEIETEVTEESTKYKFLKITVSVLVAALVAGAVIAYFFFPGAYKILVEPETVISKIISPKKAVPLPLPISLRDSINMADSIVRAQQPSDLPVEKRDTVKNQTNKVRKQSDTTHIITPPATLSNAAQPTFEIIAASLNRMSDAKNSVEKFKSLGINASIINAPKKRKNKILISIGSFNTMPAAQTELIRVKNKIEKGAYIYNNSNLDKQE